MGEKVTFRGVGSQIIQLSRPSRPQSRNTSLQQSIFQLCLWLKKREMTKVCVSCLECLYQMCRKVFLDAFIPSSVCWWLWLHWTSDFLHLGLLFSGLVFRLLYIFELIFARMDAKAQLHYFCMWISSFPSTFCWKDCLLSWDGLNTHVKKCHINKQVCIWHFALATCAAMAVCLHVFITAAS